jgi:hypothetical protein
MDGASCMIWPRTVLGIRSQTCSGRGRSIFQSFRPAGLIEVVPSVKDAELVQRLARWQMRLLDQPDDMRKRDTSFLGVPIRNHTFFDEVFKNIAYTGQCAFEPRGTREWDVEARSSGRRRRYVFH